MSNTCASREKMMKTTSIKMTYGMSLKNLNALGHYICLLVRESISYRLALNYVFNETTESATIIARQFQ